MQFHALKRKTPNKTSRQVGRGGTRGKTAGRGTKGQNARSGRKKRPEWRDTIKRIPKLRGRGISGLKSYKPNAFPVNLSTLEKEFNAGDIVSPKTLADKGIFNTKKGSTTKVKILGTGELKKKLAFEGVTTSATALEKINAVGGTVK